MSEDTTVILDPVDGERLAALDRRAATLRELLEANPADPALARQGVGVELARVTTEAQELREAQPRKLADALGWVVAERSPFSVFKLVHGQRPPRGQSGEDERDAERGRPVIEYRMHYRIPVPAPNYDVHHTVWHRPAGIVTHTRAEGADVEWFAEFHGIDAVPLPFSWIEPGRRSAWLLVGPFGAGSLASFASPPRNTTARARA